MNKLLKVSILSLGLACMMNLPAAEMAAAQSGSHELNVQLNKAEIKQISNIVYAQPSSRGFDVVGLRMDILQPKTTELKPAVIFVTGGGFINANKDNGIQSRMALAEAGYVVASIEYRVAPTGVFPQPLEDVKSAVRYLRANAAKFGINPDKIGLMGGSAGGYLVGMAGTTNGDTKYDKGDNLDVSSDVQAVADIYGISDLLTIGSDYSAENQQLHRSSGATEALWLKGSPVFDGRDGGVQDYPEQAAAASPINNITSKTPPFLLMHGDVDKIVSPSQSAKFYEALTSKGIKAEYYVVKGANHGGVYWVQPEVVNKVVAFFNAHLK